jgi:hexosaminidase
MEKAYQFDPVPPELSREEQVRVLGGQCQLWSEYIATPAHFEYMAFPRLSALAESVWTPVERKDYESFQSRMDTQKQRYRLLGVNFRDK